MSFTWYRISLNFNILDFYILALRINYHVTACVNEKIWWDDSIQMNNFSVRYGLKTLDSSGNTYRANTMENNKSI